MKFLRPKFYSFALKHSCIFFLATILSLISIGKKSYAMQRSTNSTLTENRFIREGDKIKLLSANGNEIISLKLFKDVKYRMEKSWDGKKEVKVKTFFWTQGAVSENGHFAAVMRSTYEYIPATETGLSSTSTLQYIRNDSAILWEKLDIDFEQDVKISTDGHAVAFIQVEYDFKYSYPRTKKWFVVCNSRGNELFKSEPYGDIHSWQLTKNGEYGFFKASPGFICFEVSTKRTHIIERSKVPDGWLSISEDGRITATKGRIVDQTGQVVNRGEIVYEYKF